MALLTLLGERIGGTLTLLADSDGALLGADAAAAFPAAFYHQTFYVNPAIAADLQPYFDADIAPRLLTATGRAFSVTTSPTVGGTINVDINPALADQEYTISGSIGGTLNIRGGKWRGCKHGLYAWLEELGIIAIAPTTRFLIVPSLSDLRRDLSIQRTPAFVTFTRGEQGFPGGAFDAIEDVFFPWLDSIGAPLAHFTDSGLAPGHQPFGGHSDAGAYTARQSYYDADPTHFAQLNPTWKPLRSYTYTQQVAINGNVYTVRLGGDGVSAASGGPTGTGTNIVDGSVHWDWVSAGERLAGGRVWHMTHEGHASGTNYSGATPLVGVTGIRADDFAEQIAAKRALVASNPGLYDGLTLGLSAAAADGADYCKDDKCTDLLRNISGGTITTDALPSDLFGWRNGRIWEVASTEATFYTWEITDYAYDLQSAPPTPGWTMNANIRWLLANWNYPRETLPSEVRFERWDARAGLDGFHLGIYDYWSLPGHSLSDPRQSPKMMWQRIASTLATNVSTWTIETTHSIGCTAIHIWGALQQIWKGASDYETLMTRWCGLAFGAAAATMKEAFDYWWQAEDIYFAHAYLLGNVMDAMHRADALVTSDANSRARVASWMVFATWTHHKAVWYARTVGELIQSRIASHAYAVGDRYQCLEGAGNQYIVTATAGAGLTAAGTGPTGTGTGITDGDLTVDYYSPGGDALATPLLRHVYKSVDLHMIDTHAVAYTILLGPVSPGFYAQWSVPQDDTWKIANDTLPYANDGEIRTVFDAARALYPAPDKAHHTAAIETSLVAPFSPTGTTLITDTIFLYRYETVPEGYEYIFQVFPSDTGVIRIINVAVAATPAAEMVGRLNVYNAATGALAYTADPVLDSIGTNFNHDITLASLAPGFYRLRVLTYLHTVIYQGHTPIVMTTKGARLVWHYGGVNDNFFPVYKNVTKFNFFTWNGEMPSFYDGNDNPVAATRVSAFTFTITVPAGQDQKTWKWSGSVACAGHVLDMLYWSAPRREQIIWPSNLYNE